MSKTSGERMDRRTLLEASLRAAGAAYVTLHWPKVVAAAQHAVEMRQADPSLKLEVLTAEQAVEFEAVASRIIPSDDSPGAREAGVIYFLDRALATFAADQRDLCAAGLPVLLAKTHEIYPALEKFSLGTLSQQDAVLSALEGQPFFELIRTLTITGFLADPSRGGNRGEVGWKLIGFNDSPAFAPPFGYYDRDYAGWQPPKKVR